MMPRLTTLTKNIRRAVRARRQSLAFIAIATLCGYVAGSPALAQAPYPNRTIRIVVGFAAGGIADGRGIAAAIALGASAVQIGTGYLLCAEAPISRFLRAALKSPKDNVTAVTNVVSGRPARVFMNRVVREVGPVGLRSLGQ